MLTLPSIKKGDTFVISCIYKDDTGQPQNLTGTTLRSQVRSAATKKLVAELVVVVLDQGDDPGAFSITADTSEWPVGTVVLDIETQKASTVVSTETVQIQVVQDITHD